MCIDDKFQQRLIIDSRDRNVGTSITDATYTLDNPLVAFNHCRVDWVYIFNTFFNITNLSITIDGNIIKTIPNGYYTKEELVTEIDSKIKEVDANIGCIFNTSTNLVDWNILSHSIQTNNSHTLGMYSQKVGSFSTLFNTSAPHTVEFFSPQLKGSDVYRRTNRNQIDATPLAVVPIFSDHNTLNFWQPTYPLAVDLDNVGQISRLNVSMRNTLGEILDNASDYQIHLTFY